MVSETGLGMGKMDERKARWMTREMEKVSSVSGMAGAQKVGGGGGAQALTILPTS